jgi:TonB family protein
MGYRALLFCPDEKIARTVTQVLSELEFAVEACVEPFAAVKKLMAEHFDAVVVDCDNDQNASLLFKSARSSAINQASLAVAVVEGQPGVAKAFRIGANLVLTKPINVEQAKGTLRVARGLLRKGDAAKPSAPAATPIPTTPVPPKIASTAPARPATLSAATAAKPRPAAPPISKPAANVPAKPEIQTTIAAAASTASAKAATESAGIQSAVKSALPAASSIKLPSTLNTPISSGSSASASGAASAPAPAREAAPPAVEVSTPGQGKPAVSPDKTSSEIAAEKTADTSPANTNSADSKPAESTAANAPTFTFGGANLPERSGNAGSKKIFLGIAAAVFLVCAIYFGWTQLHDKLSAPAAAPNQTSPSPTKVAAPAQSASVKSSAASATSASSPGAQTATNQSQTADSQPSTTDTASDDSEKNDAPVAAASSKPSASAPATKGASKTAGTSNSTAPANAQPVAAETAPPIILKNGSTKSSAKPPAPDAAAPSMVGLAAGGSDGSLSNITAGDNAAKPILQTLSISQGVSQGLLLKKVQPAYPSSALRMRTEGGVKLLATIGKTGNVTEVKVVSGEPLLTQSAVEAVKQWKYKPYLLNGDPVEIQTEISINFKLPR